MRVIIKKKYREREVWGRLFGARLFDIRRMIGRNGVTALGVSEKLGVSLECGLFLVNVSFEPTQKALLVAPHRNLDNLIIRRFLREMMLLTIWFL